MKEFSLNLKRLRKAKGLNQDELADELGVRKSTISNYETGYSNPTASMLNHIADYFRVTLDELCGKAAISPQFNEPAMEESSETILSVPVYDSLVPNTTKKPLFSLSFPSSFLGNGNFFIVKVADKTMTRADLTNGSLVIIREQKNINNGELALVSINNEPAFFCRYYNMGEFVSLTFDGAISTQPIMVNPKEQMLIILGKVTKVIHSVL